MKGFNFITGEGWDGLLMQHPDTELVMHLGYGDACGGYGVRVYKSLELIDSKTKQIIFAWTHKYTGKTLDEAVREWLYEEHEDGRNIAEKSRIQ